MSVGTTGRTSTELSQAAGDLAGQGATSAIAVLVTTQGSTELGRGVRRLRQRRQDVRDLVHPMWIST